MKPLRLAMIAQRFWPRVGALESRAAGLACELADRGAEVTVVTARWHEEWPAEIYYHGSPVVRLWPPPLGRWKAWRWSRSLVRWLRRNEDHFDAVLVWGMMREAKAAIAALAGRVPVVLVPERTGWQGDCFCQARKAGGRDIRRACLQASAFVATSPAARRELEAAGYPRERIRDVPSGVPLLLPRTKQTQADARELLADANPVLSLAASAPLAISTTRLAADRGWEHLLAAWSIVARQMPAARLWLAGEAPQTAIVNRQIDARGITASVNLVGQFDETAQLLSAGDVLVSPSPESGTQSILEAMSAGTPVVAADIPANRFLLGDEAAGLLVPPDNIQALAAAIVRLLVDTELARRLGTAGQCRAQGEFSMAAMADGFCEVLAAVRTR